MAKNKKVTDNWKCAMASFIWSFFAILSMLYYIVAEITSSFLLTYWAPLFMLSLLWFVYSIYSLVKIYKEDQYFTQYLGFHGTYLTIFTYASAFEIGRGKIHFLFLLLSILLIIPYNFGVRTVKRKKEEGSERHIKIYKKIRLLPLIAILFATGVLFSYKPPFEIGLTIFTYIYLILTGLFSTIYIADWLEQRKHRITN